MTENEWISVNDRIPINQTVIVTVKRNNELKVTIGWSDDDGNIHAIDYDEILAWMPLPDPYGEGELD